MDPEEVSKLQAALSQANGSPDYPGDWPANGNKVFHNMCRRFPGVDALIVVKTMAAQGYIGGKVAAQLENEQARQAMDPDEKATLLKLISEATGECDFPSNWPYDKAKSILDRLRTEYCDVNPADIVKIMIAENYDDNKRGPSPGKVTTQVMKLSREQKAAEEAAEVAKLPDLNLSVYLLSGEKVWGPGAVSGSLCVSEFMNLFAEAVGEPVYKLKLFHGEVVLPCQARLGHCAGIADESQLTLVVADVSTTSTSQLTSEGRCYVVNWLQRAEGREYGEDQCSMSFYEWPQTSGLYWSWLRIQGCSHEPDSNKIEGPFNKTYVDVWTTMRGFGM